MKTIGLIGGMSWESTAVYYRMINESVRRTLGGLNSAKVIIESLNFLDIVSLQRLGAWDDAADQLSAAAVRLERSGADIIAICTNTMHKLAPQVEASITVPLLHIADVTRNAVLASGLTTIGLLGTRYTMEQDFLRHRLSLSGGPAVIIPSDAELDMIHNVIFHELCIGDVKPDSRKALLHSIDNLHHAGAKGIVLGCTELMLILRQEDCPIPLFDTTLLHSRALVEFALDSTANYKRLDTKSHGFDSVLSIA
jgi:aspartate racemase